MAVGPSPLPRRAALSVRRLVALGVLAVMAALYVGPVQKYLRVQRELEPPAAALARRRAQRGTAALHQRARRCDTDARIILLARELRLDVPRRDAAGVQGLPRAASASCR